MTKKDRKKSGRIYPNPTIPKKVLDKENIYIGPIWSDWIDYRDGCRGYDDRTKIRYKYMCHADYLEVKRWNKKNKLLLKRRKARKEKNVTKSKLF